MTTRTIFLLGATGYVGGDLLVELGHELPDLHVTALVRSPTTERIARLHASHPNLSIVEGSLDDVAIVEKQCEKADIVINAANSDHLPASQAIISGLRKGLEAKPENPPLYIQISGMAVLSDDANGEFVENPKVWSDIGLDLKSLPSDNMHLDVDIPIVEAGTNKEKPIRTIIIFPGLVRRIYIGPVYGIGIQKTTIWLRKYLDNARTLRYAGYYGSGENTINNVHVKDVSSAVLCVLKVALEHKADEGTEGLYFVASDAPTVNYREWQAAYGDHRKYLYSKSLIKEPGSRPFTKEALNFLERSSAMHVSWRILGANKLGKSDRLKRFGWQPVETYRHPLLETLPETVDVALQG